MSEIRGYKVFNSDWTCRDFQYEVGKTFEHKGNISMCGSGFHFCQVASDCFNYYSFDSKNKVAEVVALDLVETDGNKSVTNKLQVVREIEWSELLTIVNIGKDCTGLSNTGNWNTGNRNTGNRNTGDWNTGNRNTGDWNTGDWNTGWFSTITPKVSLFEKETNFTFNEIYDIKGVKVLNWNYENDWWIYEENMTDEEKENNPTYKTTGGYLKTIPFKDACVLMWDNLDESDREEVRKIPNFDAKIFEEITGIKA